MKTDRVRLDSFPFSCGAFDPAMQLEIRDEVLSPAAEPVVAFIMPIHNQGTSILNNLRSARAHASLSHEFILVVDGCTDATRAAVDEWVVEVRGRPDHTARILIVDVPEGIFETLSDAVGIHLSTAPYVIEIQADMSIDHLGFDRQLVRILETNSDIFAVGGRGGHDLARVAEGFRRLRIFRKIVGSVSRRWTARRSVRRGFYVPSVMEYFLSDSIGRVGDLVELPVKIQKIPRIYLHETIMRGPLAFSRVKYDLLGGLDTESFFLGNDDHDLILRAWTQLRLRSAYFPISFSSPLDQGSTRALKTVEQQNRFSALLSHYSSTSLASELFLWDGTVQRPRHRRSRRISKENAHPTPMTTENELL